MRKVIFAIMFVSGLVSISQAQQVPLISQYNSNRYLYNPAHAGLTGDIQLYAHYRRQWSDFEGAPETRILTFDMPIVDRIAIGGQFFSDDVSIFRRYGGYVSFAYHLPFKGGHKLSFGVSGGAQDQRIDFDEVFVIDPTDDRLTFNEERGTAFDASAGINYSWKGLNVGFSAPQLVSTELAHLDDDVGTAFSLDRHYLANASYKIGLGGDSLGEKLFYLEPYVMFRTTSKFDPWQLDGGVALYFKDWVWIDGLYRHDFGVSFGGGVNLFQQVKIGYHYDLAINDLSDYAGATHDIMVGISFGKKKKKEAASEELVEKLDSIMEEQNERVDSILNNHDQRLDSLTFAIDSLNQLIESGEFLIDSEEFDELQRKLQEMDSLYQSKVGELEDQVKRNAETDRQYDEERTRVVDEEDLEFKRGAELGDYFMVVGSFRIENNSYKFQEQLDADGYKSGVVYDKKRKWYYVYMSKPEDWDSGLEELYKLREENPRFYDAWIHIMSKSLRDK